MSPQHRSIHPNVPGVPWWGAVMIVVTATAIGFAFDAGGGKELTHVFAALYIIGCIVAVLMVRQSGIFTAVVQPPMILFVSVPGAYFLFHGAKITGIKDVVINCAYPLIERFPLMLFTSGVVLLIGLIRWFVGSSSSAAAAKPAKTTTINPFAAITAKVRRSLLFQMKRRSAPKRRHAVERPKSTRSAQPTKRAEPPRRRRSRPAHVEDELAPERPRRRTSPPPWEPDERVDLPRRRSPAARTARNPYERREPYERRAPHERRSRYDSYDPFEAYEAPARRRPGTNGAAVTNARIIRSRGCATAAALQTPRADRSGRCGRGRSQSNPTVGNTTSDVLATRRRKSAQDQQHPGAFASLVAS